MPRLIEGPYLADLLEQPDALKRTVDQLPDTPLSARTRQRFRDGRWGRILLTGMGSSFHALAPLHLRLLQRRAPALHVETSELLGYLAESLDPDDLIIAVSQSGRSAEILGLLECAAGQAYVIGVTNDAASPLAQRADEVILLSAGAESTVSCKTYLATLAGLDWLQAALLDETDGDPLRQAWLQGAELVAGYLVDWRSKAEALMTRLSGVDRVFVTGRGPSLAAAGTGGLILKEATRIAAEGMSSAAFRHGPFEALGPGVFVAVLGGDPQAEVLNRRLTDDVRRAGGDAAFLAMNSEDVAFRLPLAPERLRPTLEILPIQLMSLALAALRDREAGLFELATKITAVE